MKRPQTEQFEVPQTPPNVLSIFVFQSENERSWQCHVKEILTGWIIGLPFSWSSLCSAMEGVKWPSLVPLKSETIRLTKYEESWKKSWRTGAWKGWTKRGRRKQLGQRVVSEEESLSRWWDQQRRCTWQLPRKDQYSYQSYFSLDYGTLSLLAATIWLSSFLRSFHLHFSSDSNASFTEGSAARDSSKQDRITVILFRFERWQKFSCLRKGGNLRT